MSYSRWGPSPWYIFWHASDDDTKEGQRLAIWHIKDKNTPVFTYKELENVNTVEDLKALLKLDIPDGEYQEALYYIREWREDIAWQYDLKKTDNPILIKPEDKVFVVEDGEDELYFSFKDLMNSDTESYKRIVEALQKNPVIYEGYTFDDLQSGIAKLEILLTRASDEVNDLKMQFRHLLRDIRHIRKFAQCVGRRKAISEKGVKDERD